MMSAVLSSWKEIASYLGKGVRTVQRWELEMALPVRRPKPKYRQIVLAFPEELNHWLRAQPKHHYVKPTTTLAHTRGLLAITMEHTRRAKERIEQLRQRAAALTRFGNGPQGAA